MEGKLPNETLRRKDFMAYLAVGLFVFVIVFEVILVAWLPLRLNSSTMWQDQVVCEEMIEHEDLLRAYMIDIKKRSKNMDGEIALVQDSLDEIASYLHEYKDKLSRTNVDQITRYLDYFENIYRNNIKSDKSFITNERIDPVPFLGRLAGASNVPGPGTSGNKAGLEK